jgi:hypothetical protein
MAALGFAIGARPSLLRPIRCGGETPDYDRSIGDLTLRRSHAGGMSVMETTKNAHDVTIRLPRTMTEILEWHVATSCTLRTVRGSKRPCKTSQRRSESELLFLSKRGGLQSTTSLWKPFAAVSAKMAEVLPGFSKVITPKGMRRTSKDLLRAAGVRRTRRLVLDTTRPTSVELARWGPCQWMCGRLSGRGSLLGGVGLADGFRRRDQSAERGIHRFGIGKRQSEIWRA